MVTSPIKPINPARLHSDLAAINAIGRDPATAELSRPSGSEAESAAGEWLRRRIEATGADLVPGPDLLAVAAIDAPVRPLLISGALAMTTNLGPLDGVLALMAGLEVLRCLPAPVAGIALTAGRAEVNPSIVFDCAATGGPMLTDSGRAIGVALSDTVRFDMREVLEIGEACGIEVLPLPRATNVDVRSDVRGSSAQVCTLSIDAATNRWPLDDEGRAAVTACATLLLNLVDAALAR